MIRSPRKIVAIERIEAAVAQVPRLLQQPGIKVAFVWPYLSEEYSRYGGVNPGQCRKFAHVLLGSNHFLVIRGLDPRIHGDPRGLRMMPYNVQAPPPHGLPGQARQ
jgi:hypothetical protein